MAYGPQQAGSSNLNNLQKEEIDDLRIWSSQKIRACQTASKMANLAGYIEYWKCLDEIDAVG